MSGRRSFLQAALGLGAGMVALPGLSLARTKEKEDIPPIPLVAPDVPQLPWRMVGGVKEFRLVAEPVRRELMPGRVMDVWGYNGSCPGPVIQAVEGDRVRIILENRLPESTSMHWHGLEVPVAMDGMPYVSQPPIPPGGTFAYEFTLRQNGTFFYHSHGAMQEMMGMIGLFIIHPRVAHAPRVDHDFGIILQGWALLPNSTVPNTAGMEFNWLTFNGKAGPATTPLLVRHGSRVRIRVVNLGMDHHPIHLHGHTFYVTGTEAGRKPASLWYAENTVLVGVAQARDFEFEAVNPGDWMIHCHLPHHMMNNMSDLMSDRMITPMALSAPEARSQMGLFARELGVEHPHHAPVADGAEQVPGFPQDAFMEMNIDPVVARPETHGMAAGWTAGMMGMMTLLRVLPPRQYDHIQSLLESHHHQDRG
jgi:FtsP/CotA-like multicopper oxidase with cupredoxin domain